jgi:hypothetical protein
VIAGLLDELLGGSVSTVTTTFLYRPEPRRWLPAEAAYLDDRETERATGGLGVVDYRVVGGDCSVRSPDVVRQFGFLEGAFRREMDPKATFKCSAGSPPQR